ncbi:hypothetical protein JOQ06_011997, partial [Pogonophryne albipinna]
MFVKNLPGQMRHCGSLPSHEQSHDPDKEQGTTVVIALDPSVDFYWLKSSKAGRKSGWKLKLDQEVKKHGRMDGRCDKTLSGSHHFKTPSAPWWLKAATAAQRRGGSLPAVPVLTTRGRHSDPTQAKIFSLLIALPIHREEPKWEAGIMDCANSPARGWGVKGGSLGG